VTRADTSDFLDRSGADAELAVGDFAFQKRCMDFAKSLQQRNATILFVSHNMFTIKALCDRAIYLSAGQVAQDSDTASVTRLYDQEAKLDMAGWAQNLVGADPTKCPIFISKIEILDELGRPSQMFEHGARLRLRLHYVAQERIETPNFNVAILRSDGIDCCNYNTSMDQFPTGTVSGEGVIEMTTPPIKLIAEPYSVQVLVWDSSFQRLYCAQQGGTFHVRHDILSTEFGVFHEHAQWRRVEDPVATALSA
jgi:lipopolysaccharide transport system ATP-binding protein